MWEAIRSNPTCCFWQQSIFWADTPTFILTDSDPWGFTTITPELSFAANGDYIQCKVIFTDFPQETYFTHEALHLSPEEKEGK